MRKAIITLAILFFLVNGRAQNVGIGTSTPVASAQLDVSSTDKGLLPPRMTSEQRNAIAGPVAGLVIFNTTTNTLQYFTGSAWVSLITSPAVFMPTIVIGTQQWMTKNLDAAFYRNGDPIPQVTDVAEWDNLTTGAWCYYYNDSTLGNTYGKLYNWYAVNDPRGLAPSGWHIPNNAEWTILQNKLGGASVAGGKLKEAGVVHWTNPNAGGNNNSGWSGLPGGFQGGFGGFGNIGISGYWWSSTEYDPAVAWYWGLTTSTGGISWIDNLKNVGVSVRCLRD